MTIVTTTSPATGLRLLSTIQRESISTASAQSDSNTVAAEHVIATLTLSGIDTTGGFGGSYPPIAAGTQRTVSLMHNGTEVSVEVYTGNIYLAAVPAAEVLNVPPADWPSPIVRAGNNAAAPVTYPTRLPVSNKGIVGWLEQVHNYPTTSITVTTGVATLTNVPVSFEGSNVVDDYVILIQQIDTDGTVDDIKLLTDLVTDVQYDLHTYSGSYPSGITPFSLASTYAPLTALDADALAALETAYLDSRIRAIPRNLDDLDYTTLADYGPEFRLFPVDEDDQRATLELRGWYFNAVDRNGAPIGTVPHRFKATAQLQKWNGVDAFADVAGQTVVINATTPSQVRQVSFGDLDPAEVYRIHIITAAKGNTTDGDGDDDYAYHIPSNTGTAYTQANAELAITNLFSDVSAVISQAGAKSLDSPAFRLLERVGANNTSYTIAPNATDPAKFDLSFTVSGLSSVSTLTITSGTNTDTSDVSAVSEKTVVFTALTEAEIESNWNFTAAYGTYNIQFAYTIGADSIGSLEATADGVFSLSNTAGVTSISMLNSLPAVYSTKTITLAGKLTASKVQYSQTSTRDLSYNLPTGQIIQALSIETEEYSPFGPNYIQYSIVANDIEYPITPLNQDGTWPKVYHFNSTVPEEDRAVMVGQGFIDTDVVGSYTIRIGLSRPAGSLFTSPLVTGIGTMEIRTDS